MTASEDLVLVADTLNRLAQRSVADDAAELTAARTAMARILVVMRDAIMDRLRVGAFPELDWELTDDMRAKYKRWHLAVHGLPAPEGSVDDDLRALHREGLL